MGRVCPPHVVIVFRNLRYRSVSGRMSEPPNGIVRIENIAVLEMALVIEDSMGWIVIHFSEWCRNITLWR